MDKFEHSEAVFQLLDCLMTHPGWFLLGGLAWTSMASLKFHNFRPHYADFHQNVEQAWIISFHGTKQYKLMQKLKELKLKLEVLDKHSNRCDVSKKVMELRTAFELVQRQHSPDIHQEKELSEELKRLWHLWKCF
ncbi:hypothetical protein Ancab_022936 [Ancistrocladus abbreviatus]